MDDRHAQEKGVTAVHDAVVLLAQSVTAAAREEVDRADTKASLLLAASGVVVGALLAALLDGKWSPFGLDNRVEWLWWLGVAAAAGGLAALGAAVYPRTERRVQQAKPLIAYYGDVASLETSRLEEALQNAVSAPREAPLDQLRQISLIVRSKYRLIQLVILALGGAAVACMLALLTNIAF